MKEVKVYRKIIDSTGFGELDFRLNEDFGVGENDYITFVGERGRADAFPVKIDDMIDRLVELKEKGATHVEIDYHCDHIDYEIDGLKLELATDDHIDAEVMKKLPDYIEKVKEQLECNATDYYKDNYITYTYTNEQIDENLEYFKTCLRKNLSAYKALLYFNN